MNCLVTGGAGFIGSRFVHLQREKYPEDTLINVDALTYAGNLQNLSSLSDDERHCFIHADITDEAYMRALFGKGIDAVVNFAAHSHVDRSIIGPGQFLHTNVKGTQVLLELCRTHKCRFVQVSTDEVYGSTEDGYFHEESPLAPNSPYAASKASADLFVRAYFKTYGVDALITRCTNNFGPYQHPEKLVPRMLLRAINHQPLPVFGDGLNVRDWIYVDDHCQAIDLVLRKGNAGEVYNVSAGNERTNLDIIHFILKALEQSTSPVQYVKDRLGHDRRYAMTCAKIHRLGWRPATGFEDGLRTTIQWYLDNEPWWKKMQDEPLV